MKHRIEPGQTVISGSLATTFLVTGDMVDGAYCVTKQTIAPGQLFWPHVHTTEDQVVVVLSGELGVRVGDTEWTVGPGEVAYRPHGLPHTVWNSGSTPVEMMEITSPGSFDQYLMSMSRVGANVDARAALLAEYEVSAVPGWDAELFERYNVKQQS